MLAHNVLLGTPLAPWSRSLYGAAQMNVGIKSGDTLSQLAQQHGTSVDALMKANPKIKDANLIYAGDTLNIPGKGGDGFSPSGGSPRGMSGPGGDSFQPGGQPSGPGAAGPVGPAPKGQVGDWINQATS